MSILQSDGSCYLMGTSQAQLQNWICYVSSKGNLAWTVECPASSCYRGAVQSEGKVYALMNEYGKPVQQRKPYFLPIAADGTQDPPIFLPAWAADATAISIDSAFSCTATARPLSGPHSLIPPSTWFGRRKARLSRKASR